MDSLLAALRTQIEARGESLLVLPDATEQWLSPTQADLRYGEVCIVRTQDGILALVRTSSCRAPAKTAGKRTYRRWHGIDILTFLTTGRRREIRIAKVLKRSRC